MIVNKIKSQIVFGLIAVIFTCIMAFIQIRNLSQDIVVEAPKPATVAVALEPEPEPEPVIEVEQPPPLPEPEPEPQPFVMKEVGGPDAIAGEYLISFFDENDRKAFEKLVEEAGGAVLGHGSYGNVVKVLLKDAAQLEELLRKGPVPLDYSANYSVYYPERPTAEVPKPDKFYGVFGSKALVWLGLNADHVNWGSGVKVAILDNGVFVHPVFKPGKVRQIDLLENAPKDGSAAGHGTAVASLIMGWHPEVMGVAPDAELLSVRVAGGDGKGDVFAAAQGIMRAVEEGANVISISMGTYGDSFVLRNAIKEAISRGVAVVASVGNDAKDGATFPAAYDGVVGVSAVDTLGQKLFFGNTGDGVDICAPGYGLKAAWRDGQFTEDFSGTSAAVPYVSGMVAVLMARGLNAEEAVQRVIEQADDSGLPGKDPAYGNGILDIRRVQEYGERGVWDAALSCLIVKDRKTVILGFQNRGNERLDGARIAVKAGERFINFNIGPTKPGETVSKEFDVKQSDFDSSGVLNVFAEIIQTGLHDNYPGNNARRIIVLGEPLRP